MFPLLLLAISGLSYIYGSEAGQARVLDAVGKFAPALVVVARDSLANVMAFRGLSNAFSVIVLWWSSKNFFLGMRYALNRALGLVSTRPFVLEVIWSLIAVPMAGMLLALASFEPFVVSRIVKSYGQRGHMLLAPIVSYIVAFIIVFCVTLVLYNKLPARKHSPKFAFPGATFCALSWAVVQFFFAIYTAHVNFFHIYGAVSAILVLLFWFYLMAMTFLFGAQLCVAYEEQRTGILLAA